MTDLVTLEARLQADANAILDRNLSSRPYVIFDIEYVYDREGQHRADRHAADPRGTTVETKPGKTKKRKTETRWPFHRIACISAMTLMVLPTGIAVENCETWSRPELTEGEIVQAFAEFVEGSTGAILTTWGGECKDLPVILSVAIREGFALPSSLANGFWLRERLDLCDLLRVKAESVHLNEYAHAQALPAKIMAPWQLGEAAEKGSWVALREHCECDVTVTTMLLVRWLLATGRVKGERMKFDREIADAMAQARPYRPKLMAAIDGFTSPALAVAA
ncbi:hypothetical protein A3736_08665 [Erythrobacter sp. HI0063]|jgi:hypothetical protein|uniref:hypothetical protein n=1 Tax=Erythrobacter sp. HI0063 TaxID=1822240 RepID=UPI0007C26957|nr:hypothetical protein [Erythrobacter sp. HI0063]KZY56331.1 hypothetical protein A3736_08665 [Erythrobacter sp. HI0063]